VAYLKRYHHKGFVLGDFDYKIRVESRDGYYVWVVLCCNEIVSCSKKYLTEKLAVADAVFHGTELGVEVVHLEVKNPRSRNHLRLIVSEESLP
jgi:hypothetical protein